MGLYSIIPGFCGAPWVVGAPRIVPTFHPTSNGPVYTHTYSQTKMYSDTFIISNIITVYLL